MITELEFQLGLSDFKVLLFLPPAPRRGLINSALLWGSGPVDSDPDLAVGPIPQAAQQGLLRALWFPQSHVLSRTWGVRCSLTSLAYLLWGRALLACGFMT